MKIITWYTTIRETFMQEISKKNPEIQKELYSQLHFRDTLRALSQKLRETVKDRPERVKKLKEALSKDF